MAAEHPPLVKLCDKSSTAWTFGVNVSDEITLTIAIGGYDVKTNTALAINDLKEYLEMATSFVDGQGKKSVAIAPKICGGLPMWVFEPDYVTLIDYFHEDPEGRFPLSGYNIKVPIPRFMAIIFEMIILLKDTSVNVDNQ